MSDLKIIYKTQEDVFRVQQMLLSCVYEGGEHLQSLAWGLHQKYYPLQIQKSLWFPPLATPCVFILHPILASVLSAVCILSFSLDYRFLPQCLICGPGDSPAPIPNRTAAPLHQSWGGHTCFCSANCLTHTCPSCAHVTSKECVTCKCSFLPYGASVHSTEDKSL